MNDFLPTTFWGWSIVFLAIAALVIAVAAMLKIASNRDDDMLGDLQYEESPTQDNFLICAKCGDKGTVMRLVWNLERDGREMIHAGGCPRDRQGPRRRPQE